MESQKMITVYRSGDDMELLFIRMELEADAIPHFVVGQYFGSLYPGLQIAWYNERSILVPANRVHDVREIIQRVYNYHEPSSVNLDKKSKLRIICEALLFGWIMPVGSKRA